MRKSGDIKGSKLKNILGLYIQVSILHVYEYESREEKGSGQKGTRTGQGWLRASLRTNPLEKGIDHGRQGGSITSCFTLPPTKKPVGVGHTTIYNILGGVSGMYEVFFG